MAGHLGTPADICSPAGNNLSRTSRIRLTVFLDEVMNVLTAVITAPGDKKMKNFTIENETNNITVHASVKEAEALPNSGRFGNEAALAKLAANWPAARLVETYNSLPGETPVKKFKDRATAVSRIWKAIQRLGEVAPVAGEPAPVPETAQLETVIPESAVPAPATTVAPQSPDVASSEPGANRRPPARKRRPSRRPRKKLAPRVRAAKPAR